MRIKSPKTRHKSTRVDLSKIKFNVIERNCFVTYSNVVSAFGTSITFILLFFLPF